MTIFRCAFLAIISDYVAEDFFEVHNILLHGLATDMTMSAYLMVIPGLLMICHDFVPKNVFLKIGRVYWGLVATLMSIVYVIDIVLFPYWGFRLDTTPLFYMVSSPSSAFASLNWREEVVIVAIIIILAIVIALLLNKLWSKITTGEDKPKGIVGRLILILLVAALFIPIRGGLTEATMTPGRGFYSKDMRYNQATVNPMFSFFYALIHNDSPEGQFRFFESDKEARKVWNKYIRNSAKPAKTLNISLSTKRPDIYLVIAESFSSSIMPSLGGDAIATGLDSIAVHEGILFTNFYAESFRTDRALPTILSGYPAQPTTSAIRYTAKLGNLPSLARELGKAGWNSIYYYGGDADFTNMRAYLVASGFDRIISETDFDSEERSASWGVPDGILLKRAVRESRPHDNAAPRFTVIQTSSSHEPFDVPIVRFDNPAANAFAYTDSCIVAFVNGLKQLGRWDNSLVLVVADHWGCYPENPSDDLVRHHVPFIITGGAVRNRPQRFDRVSSQSDIAPTLMSVLGIEDEVFVFGKDLTSAKEPAFAWISDRNIFGIVNSDNTLNAVNVESAASENADSSSAPKAFIQLLYSDLSRR